MSGEIDVARVKNRNEKKSASLIEDVDLLSRMNYHKT